MKDRRDFIACCAAGAALIAAPGALLAADLAAAPAERASCRVSKEAFQSLLDEEFRCFTAQGEALSLKLAEVRDGPQAHGLEQFSLLLKADGSTSPSTPLPPEIYLLEHPRMGRALVRLDPSDTVARAYSTQFVLLT